MVSPGRSGLENFFLLDQCYFLNLPLLNKRN